jgi:hypothetical protein
MCAVWPPLSGGTFKHKRKAQLPTDTIRGTLHFGCRRALAPSQISIVPGHPATSTAEPLPYLDPERSAPASAIPFAIPPRQRAPNWLVVSSHRIRSVPRSVDRSRPRWRSQRANLELEAQTPPRRNSASPGCQPITVSGWTGRTWRRQFRWGDGRRAGLALR